MDSLKRTLNPCPLTFLIAMKNFTKHIRLERKKKMALIVLPLIGLLLLISAGALYTRQLPFWPMLIVCITGMFVVQLIRKKADQVIDHFGKMIDWTRRGEKAEKAVEEILNQLPSDSFQVWHDIDCGTHNIDHLVVSSTGQITVIETKSHGGTISATNGQIKCNGKAVEKDFIKQTISNVMQIREQIMQHAEQDIWVNGIICFPNAFVKVSHPIRNIKITYGKALLYQIEHSNANPTHLHEWLWENLSSFINPSGSEN